MPYKLLEHQHGVPLPHMCVKQAKNYYLMLSVSGEVCPVRGNKAVQVSDMVSPTHPKADNSFDGHYL